ncbi:MULTISPECIES: phosphatase PAP2 family protein [Variovorax]|uniref:phosphatase PAP2 family protein n=1 Tax=Variovorax TaxID=34072 RepID=UPI00285B9C70|nr:phosphatase PAP2 family protein [Variovorax sp. 3319]MDR6889199.1 membrane-associated phospholipid phosphatase [Variovorax sp. 3319]
MNSLNLALFDTLAAGFSPSPTLLWLASAVALGSSWACAAVLAWAAWRRPPERACVLAVLAAGGAASLISHEIAASVGAPRPFMVGLSPAHVPHGVRAGLPSTHATVMFAMAFMLLLRRRLRDVGLVVLAVATVTAWSRVYAGIHFPFDIAAGALLGACIAAALFALQVAGRRLVRTPAAASSWALHALAGDKAGPSLVLMFAVAAAWIGFNTPLSIGPAILEESGPVEKSTVLLYLAAAACLLAVRVVPLSRLDKTAICTVLLAFAARELDGHLLRYGNLIFAPIAVAGVWLARRAWAARQGLRAWWQRRPEATTVLTFAAVIGTAIVLDQVPAAGLYRNLMLSFEEVFELALPALALLGIMQARWGMAVAESGMRR